MAELKWTQESLDWLKDIHRHIAHDNPQAAAKVIDGIVAKAELLTRFPGSRHALAHRARGPGAHGFVWPLPRRLSTPSRSGSHRDYWSLSRRPGY